jgi:mRNA interferase MazF
VLPITSELRAEVRLRVDLQPNLENGLRTTSQVMTDWPQTVRYVDMGPVIGHLDAATMRAITRQVAVVLGIGNGTGRPRRTGSPAIGRIDPP